MSRFWSGSAGVGEELARYGGSGVWNEDGTEKQISGVCGVCEMGCVQTVKHVLMECKAYMHVYVKNGGKRFYMCVERVELCG